MPDIPTPALATRWKRLLAWLIDLALILGGALVLPRVGGLVDPPTDSHGSRAALVLAIVWAVAALAYAPVAIHRWGATLGRKAMRVRVVSTTPELTVGWARSVLRFVVAFASTVTFLFVGWLDYVWLLWDPRRQCLHDKAARTVVVRAGASDSEVALAVSAPARPPVTAGPPPAWPPPAWPPPAWPPPALPTQWPSPAWAPPAVPIRPAAEWQPAPVPGWGGPAGPPPAYPAGFPWTGFYPPPPSPSGPGNGCSFAGIILGSLAFVLFPIILGPAGLIVGAIGLKRKETKAPVAIIVSGFGLVVGLVISAIFI